VREDCDYLRYPVSAVRQATSRKAREVAHPQLVRSMFKDKPALYFPVKAARPPAGRVGFCGTTIGPAEVAMWMIGDCTR
jgi:hypothetical protein